MWLMQNRECLHLYSMFYEILIFLADGFWLGLVVGYDGRVWGILGICCMFVVHVFRGLQR